MEHTRSIDKWLKWVALLGPFMGFLLGVGSGTIAAYQAFKSDANRISQLENWKERQVEFNQETVKAISRMKALIKDIP